MPPSPPPRSSRFRAAGRRLACPPRGGQAPRESGARWRGARPRAPPAAVRPRLLPELAGAAGREERRQPGFRAPRAMEVLPTGGGRTGRPEPEAGREDAAEEAVAGAPRSVCLRGAPPAEQPRGSRDSWEAEEDPEPGEPRSGRTSRTASLVSGLLTELYSCTEEEEAAGGSRGPGGRPRRRDSLDSSTEASGSDVFLGGRGGDSRVLQELQERPSQRHQMQYLWQKDTDELKTILQELKYRIGVQSAKLLRQLKRKDRLLHKVQRNCDIVTACLQAVSQKRRVDTKLKFTLEPSLGQNGFQQWYDALKAVCRLSTGIPKEWRRKVWLTLADHYLHSIAIDWDKTMRFTFNERSNPDDDSMGIQIVKDLHRTGCSSYCGQEAEQDRVVLKRVLLAYARWNKNVGYCQGFNILAALILEVVEGNEGDALKIMIYLIDKVLPESYFVNNLRALSVDMAVFRDLLRLKLPELSQHLDTLQRTANKESGGGYEPPLTNVFTMQWFLTLFATCLPNHTVLKIWDSVFFEGSEIILRVSLAIWAKLGEQIECCETADEFYSTMGRLTQEMLENDLLESHELMQTVYSMAPFPFPQLAELREKYTYNITPFPATVKPTSVSGRHGKVRDSDEENDPDDEDAITNAVGCLGPFSGLLAPELQKYQKQIKEPNEEQSLRSNNIAELSPGAINSCRSEYHAAFNSMMMERMTTDINALKRQYSRIKKKQQQQVHQVYIRADKGPVTSILPSQVNNSPVINHLLLGKKVKMSNRPAKNAVIHIPGHTGGRTSPVPYEDLKTKLNSPWRTHIRVHKKNMTRTKSQLGCGDTVGLIEEQNEGCKTKSPGVAEFPSSRAAAAGGEGGSSEGRVGRTIEGQSPEPAFGDADADVSAVQVKLEALELNRRDAAADPEPKAHAPCQRHFPELPDTPGETKPPQGGHLKAPIFSPFPSVKPLRKSATARNLGLYGPTERTPTVHFPHMSRGFSKSSGGNSGTKKR
ncbi:TBC1 domain family member 30 isoform X2 [Leopardus geoffroyi]|uniref:TBC1 domain family member 30 isoform X2 n=1 Tax=Leopardus geoffroyi TaxID=46844 RepID=UPI001E264DDF|nr:TBC1 domain family member 30 isoform X2 [Leopardus geoffroyi]